MIKSASTSTVGKKSELVYDNLLTNIQMGHFKSGQKLPTETELVERYNVGRFSVRQAIDRLHERGIVNKKQGSGTYVSGEIELSESKPKKMVWVYSGIEMMETAVYAPWTRYVKEGLSYGALLNDLQIVYEPLERIPSNAHTYIDQEELGGVLILPSDDTDVKSLLREISVGTPTVIINKHYEDGRVASIDIDHQIIAFEATLLLLKMGHRRIMTLTLEAPAGVAEEERVKGYKQAFRKAGIQVDKSLIIEEPLGEDWDNWPQLFREALSLKPTAILLPNHGRVAHAVEILKNQGLQIPEDVSLIIFDDDPVLQKIEPTISAIRQPLDQMGRIAMETLIRMRDSQQFIPHHTRLKPELIMRRSVEPACHAVTL